MHNLTLYYYYYLSHYLRHICGPSTFVRSFQHLNPSISFFIFCSKQSQYQNVHRIPWLQVLPFIALCWISVFCFSLSKITVFYDYHKRVEFLKLSFEENSSLFCPLLEFQIFWPSGLLFSGMPEFGFGWKLKVPCVR